MNQEENTIEISEKEKIMFKNMRSKIMPDKKRFGNLLISLKQDVTNQDSARLDSSGQDISLGQKSFIKSPYVYLSIIKDKKIVLGSLVGIAVLGAVFVSVNNYGYITPNTQNQVALLEEKYLHEDVAIQKPTGNVDETLKEIETLAISEAMLAQIDEETFSREFLEEELQAVNEYDISYENIL